MISTVYSLPFTRSVGTFQVKEPLLSMPEAMEVPEVEVVTEPDCRRRETVLPVLWSQVRVVDSPAVKV